jgi:hypothetical protein
MNTKALLMIAILPCAGCSSIIEGTSQEITVNTNPAGASCVLMRQSQPLATISLTPGTVLIKKTKYDITILCDKPGFMQATYLNHSGAAGATAGNIILGGGIGWAIDSASGADNKYDSPVNVTMVPVQPTDQTAPVASTTKPAAIPNGPQS